jgi:hypothetical protein
MGRMRGVVNSFKDKRLRKYDDIYALIFFLLLDRFFLHYINFCSEFIDLVSHFSWKRLFMKDLKRFFHAGQMYHQMLYCHLCRRSRN